MALSNKLKVFGQAFFKRLAGQGRSPVADEMSAKCFTECVPKEVNLKTIRWIVFKEGKPCKRGFPLKVDMADEYSSAIFNINPFFLLSLSLLK